MANHLSKEFVHFFIILFEKDNGVDFPFYVPVSGSSLSEVKLPRWYDLPHSVKWRGLVEYCVTRTGVSEVWWVGQHTCVELVCVVHFDRCRSSSWSPWMYRVFRGWQYVMGRHVPCWFLAVTHVSPIQKLNYTIINIIRFSTIFFKMWGTYLFAYYCSQLNLNIWK